MLYPNTHALLYTLSVKGWTGSTPVNNATSPIQMKHGPAAGTKQRTVCKHISLESTFALTL